MKKYHSKYALIVIQLFCFQLAYPQCAPISTSGTHCEGQRAVFPMPSAGTGETIEWFQDPGGIVSDGTNTGPDGSHISRTDVEVGLNSKDFWVRRKTKTSIGGTSSATAGESVQPGRFGTNVANSRYDMQISPAVDFTLNSLKIWVDAYGGSTYRARVRVVLQSEAADDTKGTYSNWFNIAGSGNKVPLTIPAGIDVKAGGPYLVQIISYDDVAPSNLKGLPSYYYNSAPRNDSYLTAPNTITLSSVAKTVDNKTVYPDMTNWDITVSCPLTRVVSSKISAGCCVPVKNVMINPSAIAAPATLTVTGNDAESTNYYEWYDKYGRLITDKSGQGKTSLVVNSGEDGSYQVKVYRDPADKNKISCYKELPVTLGPLPFNINAQKAGNCTNGSIRLQATTNGLFQGWTTLDGEVDNIATPANLTTSVSPTVPTTYVARAKYQMGNLVINGDFEQGTLGVSSDYQPGNPNVTEGKYAIGKNPNTYNTYFFPIRDHTSNNGNMYIVDADVNKRLAAYKTTVRVEAGVTYAFSFWIANIHNAFSQPNPDTNVIQAAKVQFVIADQPFLQVNTPLNNSWNQYVQLYPATTTGDIQIQVRNNGNPLVLNGNDFALDDIVFAPVAPNFITDTVFVRPCTPPCVNAGAVIALDPVCKGALTLPTIKSAVPASGGTLPAVEYEWFSSTSGTGGWTSLGTRSAAKSEYTLTAIPASDIFYKRKAYAGTASCDTASTVPVRVTVINPPIAEIILPSSLVSTNTVTSYSGTTRSSSIWIEAKDPGTGYKGVWNITNGRAPLLKGRNLNAFKDSLLLKNFGDETTAEWSVNDVAGKCIASKVSVKITRKNLTAPDAGPDDTLCITQVPAYKLIGNDFSATEETAEWKLVSSVPTGAVVTQTGTTKEAGFTVPGPGVYIFSYSIINTALNISGTDQVTITVDAEVITPTLTNNGPINICVDQLNLPANAAAPGPTALGTWLFDPSQPRTTQTISNINNPTALLSNIPSPSVTKLIWEVTNGVCPKKSVPLTINQVGKITTATISLNGTLIRGTDTTVCLGTANTLLASRPDPDPAKGETGIWAVPAGSSVTIAGGNAESQPMTLNSEGNTKVAWTISTSTIAGCNPSTKEVTIKVLNKPVLQPVTGDIDLCEGDSGPYAVKSVITAGIDTLPVTKYTWASKPGTPAGSTGIATIQGASDKGNASFLFTSLATIGTTDKATITVTATNLCGISDPEDLEVTINLKPKEILGTITGISQICSSKLGRPALFSVPAASTVGVSYVWTLGNLPEVVTVVPTVTYTTTDIINQNQQNVVLKVILRNTCGDGPAQTITISVGPAQPVQVNLTGNPKICLPEDAVRFTGQTNNGGSGATFEFAVVHKNGSTGKIQAASLIPDFDLIPADLLQDGDKIRLTVIGDTATGCFVGAGGRDSLFIDGYENPDTTVTNMEDSICVGETIQLCVPGGTKNNTTFQWYQNAVAAGTSNCINLTQSLQSGLYTVKVGNGVCPDRTSSPKNIKIFDRPAVRFLPDYVMLELLASPSVRLTAVIDGLTQDTVTKISWINTEFLSDFTSNSLSATFTSPAQGGDFYYTLAAETGEGRIRCSSSGTVHVKSLPAVRPPNAFTPNGDGLNDTWQIEGISTYPNAKVSVFNRWGTRIFDAAPYGRQNEWDGTNNGSVLPTGTYYYIIDLNENLSVQSRTMTGSLTIIR